MSRKNLIHNIRIDSNDVTLQDQSISMNNDDDNGQITNKIFDDNNEHIHKTSSNSNVFSRLMQSEPHVQIYK